MLTNDRYFHQKDGLEMVSPSVPSIANCRISKFNASLRDDPALFSRYINDALGNIKKSIINDKVTNTNNLYSSLKFTYEIM